MNPQDLHIASLPGILFETCPEPEPPLEEAAQSCVHIKKLLSIMKKKYMQYDVPERADPSPPDEQGGESMLGGVIAPVVTPDRPCETAPMGG